ncbi:MAG: class A beta-lactamase-related serine hydrolase [candidate division KSB1 bacterium]|nr:class A beta-lactamase-related serine hydrolase [candidate division KSB1 bacterium]MDZ7300884.1 class A beta-lactamase-related serine hydrolase [candidate division KSB1 bacterium]MDZ7309846.1 class A beta-lactamase-related serine hydrolase [candidate division KSB1 bacterium]
MLPLLFLLAMTATIGVQQTPTSTLRENIQRLIEKHNGTVGLSIRNLTSGEQLEILGDERFPAASVIKIPIMVEAFARVASGEIDPNLLLTVGRRDKARGSGILKALSDGSSYRWIDLITMSIALSDNTATNLLLNRLGVGAVNERMKNLGLMNTLLFQKVFANKVEVHPELAKTYGLGMTTPNEMAVLLERLAKGEILSAQLSGEMVRILKAQQNTNMLPRFLPIRDDIQVAHKTGSMNAVRHDVGIVFTPRANWVICVMTKDNRDTSWSCDNAAEVLIGRISRTVFDHFSNDTGKF